MQGLTEWSKEVADIYKYTHKQTEIYVSVSLKGTKEECLLTSGHRVSRISVMDACQQNTFYSKRRHSIRDECLPTGEYGTGTIAHSIHVHIRTHT